MKKTCQLYLASDVNYSKQHKMSQSKAIHFEGMLHQIASRAPNNYLTDIVSITY